MLLLHPFTNSISALSQQRCFGWGRAFTASARAARRAVLLAGLCSGLAWAAPHAWRLLPPPGTDLALEEGSEKPQGGQRQCRCVTRSNGCVGGTIGVACVQNSVKVSLETYSTTGSSLLLLCSSPFPQMLPYKNIFIVPLIIRAI